MFAFHAHAHPSTFVSASHAVVLLHMTKDQMNTAGLPNASEHKKKNPNTRTHKKTKPQQGGKKKKKKKRKRKRKQKQAITKHNRARQATTKAERAKFGAREGTHSSFRDSVAQTPMHARRARNASFVERERRWCCNYKRSAVKTATAMDAMPALKMCAVAEEPLKHISARMGTHSSGCSL